MLTTGNPGVSHRFRNDGLASGDRSLPIPRMNMQRSSPAPSPRQSRDQ